MSSQRSSLRMSSETRESSFLLQARGPSSDGRDFQRRTEEILKENDSLLTKGQGVFSKNTRSEGFP